MLRGAEHLHRLLGALDRHLVEQDRGRLGGQIGGQNGEKGRKTVLVVGQRVGEGGFRRAAPRTNDEVDMGDFIAIADQQLANHKLVNLSHAHSSLG